MCGPTVEDGTEHAGADPRWYKQMKFTQIAVHTGRRNPQGGGYPPPQEVGGRPPCDVLSDPLNRVDSSGDGQDSGGGGFLKELHLFAPGGPVPRPGCSCEIFQDLSYMDIVHICLLAGV